MLSSNEATFIKSAAWFLILLPLPAGATDFRVDVAIGIDSAACGSVATLCASIQKAVNLAQSGDRILVAAGAYAY